MNRISENPFMYPLSRDESLRARGYRAAIIGNYLLLYFVNEDNVVVYITRIVYGRRNLADLSEEQGNWHHRRVAREYFRIIIYRTKITPYLVHGLVSRRACEPVKPSFKQISASASACAETAGDTVLLQYRYIKTALRGVHSRRKSGNTRADNNYFFVHSKCPFNFKLYIPSILYGFSLVRVR